MLEVHDSGFGWWLDTTGGGFGTAYDTWASSVSGKSIDAIIWDQGERDGTAIGSAWNSIVSTSERANYKDGLKTLFAQMRSVVGNVPIIICPIGRRAFTSYSGFQAIREIQIEVANELSYVHLMPSKTVYGLTDGVHLDQAGREALGTLQGHVVADVLGKTALEPVSAPTIANVSRSGTIVTITLSHEDGTDFTPTTGVEGIVFRDGGYPSQANAGTDIPFTSLVRTNATTITGILASTPTGDEYLINHLSTMVGVNEANLVRDDTTLALSLEPSVWADTGSGFIQLY